MIIDLCRKSDSEKYSKIYNFWKNLTSQWNFIKVNIQYCFSLDFFCGIFCLDCLKIVLRGLEKFVTKIQNNENVGFDFAEAKVENEKLNTFVLMSEFE